MWIDLACSFLNLLRVLELFTEDVGNPRYIFFEEGRYCIFPRKPPGERE